MNRPSKVDDVARREAGADGNSRLTAATGTLLTLLLLIEGYTILDVRGYITQHTAIGLTLIGPLGLKCVSTGYRFVRYYAGSPAYVARGAPHLILRGIGPVVVLSSLAVVATGVALLIDHGRGGMWLTLHQASFIAWIAVMTLHFLGHLRAAVVGTVQEVRTHAGAGGAKARNLRLVTIASCLVVGIGLAAAFTPSVTWWDLHHHDRVGHAKQ